MNIGILALIIALILLAIGAAGEAKQQGRTEKHIDVNRAAYNCPITLNEIPLNRAGGRT